MHSRRRARSLPLAGKNFECRGTRGELRPGTFLNGMGDMNPFATRTRQSPIFLPLLRALQPRRDPVCAAVGVIRRAILTP